MPIIQQLVAVYKLWHQIHSHIPKIHRYSLGIKIDQVFIETVESVFNALIRHEGKISLLERAAIKLDTLKFLLQIAWETKGLDNTKYISLSEPLAEIGRQLGGWLRKLQKENSPVK